MSNKFSRYLLNVFAGQQPNEALIIYRSTVSAYAVGPDNLLVTNQSLFQSTDYQKKQ